MKNLQSYHHQHRHVRRILNLDRFCTFAQYNTLKLSLWHIKEKRAVDQRYADISLQQCALLINDLRMELMFHPNDNNNVNQRLQDA